MLDQKIYSDSIFSKKFITWLFLCIEVLFIFHVVNVLLGMPSWNIDRLIHMGHEGNLPTWFSSALWAIAAVFAYQCKLFSRTNYEKRIWMLLAILLLILSIDEVAMIHEFLFGSFLGTRLKEIINPKLVTSWSIVAMPFIIIGMIWMGILLKNCLKGSLKAKILLISGTATLFVSACLLELLQPFLENLSSRGYFELEILFEETGEMIGAVLIISGLLVHGQVLYDRQK